MIRSTGGTKKFDTVQVSREVLVGIHPTWFVKP